MMYEALKGVRLKMEIEATENGIENNISFEAPDNPMGLPLYATGLFEKQSEEMGTEYIKLFSDLLVGVIDPVIKAYKEAGILPSFTKSYDIEFVKELLNVTLFAYTADHGISKVKKEGHNEQDDNLDLDELADLVKQGEISIGEAFQHILKHS